MTLFNSTGKAILQQAGIISGFKDTVGIFNKIEIHLTCYQHTQASTGGLSCLDLFVFTTDGDPCFEKDHPYIPKNFIPLM